MFGPYQMTVGASVKGTVLSEMSKMVALNAEGLSAMFCWSFFESYEEWKGIKLVEGMYDARLYRDFYGFNLLIGLKIYGLAEGLVEV